jgi:hypothetical protein
MFQNVNSGAPKIEASSEKKSIFRSEALRSYSDREQQPASYTLATPRSHYLLWALLVFVVSFGVITWLVEIPVYTPAIAITINANNSQNETTAATLIVVFVPADQLTRLRVGGNVILKLNTASHNVIAKIFAVEPEVLSPQDAQERFHQGVPFSIIAEPKAVALARLTNQASSALINLRGGSIEAWVQTDSKPVVAFFPLIGRDVHAPDELEAIESIASSGLVRVSRVLTGEFFNQSPVQAPSCLLREKSLQIKQNEGGSLYA